MRSQLRSALDGELAARTEMEKTTLELADLRVLNLPDGKLKELDPRSIEEVIRDEILRVLVFRALSCSFPPQRCGEIIQD